MKDDFLLEMTCSEPLSFEEEVQMQQSWREDENKCTFIILAKELCVENLPIMHGINFDENYDDPDLISKTTHAMIGDINLFLSVTDFSKESYESDNSMGICISKEVKQAELDVMIAVKNFRRKGCGIEATWMMMLYGAEQLGIQKFFVKVKEKNIISINLFKKLGFKESNYAECFKEYEYEISCDSSEEMVIMLKEKMDIKIHRWRSSLRE